MSGQQIGSVAGGLIGAFFGGPTGYAIGSAIGGAIGGYIDPTVVKGPRLTDAMQQTVSDGVPLPWGLGTFPTAGNIIWAGELIERKHEDDGKGSGQVQVTYTYHRSYAISICQGVRQPDGTYQPIAGILQVKRNGKVVYDVSPEASDEQRAQNSKFLRRARFYLGSEDQLPDSAIEAEQGVGDVPAYPGTVYMVVDQDDLTDFRGAIPQYEFVVSVCGELNEVAGNGGTWLAVNFQDANPNIIQLSTDGWTWDQPAFTPSPDSWFPTSGIVKSAAFDGKFLLTTVSASVGGHGIFSNDKGLTWNLCDFVLPATGGDCFYFGGYWHVVTGGMSRSANGVDYESVAIFAETACVFQNVIYCISQVNGGTVYKSENVGESYELVGVTTDSAGEVGNALAMGASPFSMCVGSSFGVDGGGENDRRLELIKFEVDGQIWAQVDHPLPVAEDASGACAVIHFAEALNIWAIAFHNRIAVGPSLEALSLSGREFPSAIKRISSDTEKLLICGDGPMLEASTDGLSWTSLSDQFDSTSVIGIQFIAANGDVPIPDAPGWYIGADGEFHGPSSEALERCKPSLGDIVAEACLRSGLTALDFDVSELTDEIDGYKVAIETSGEAIIGPLMQGWFFDSAEYDDKIRFIKRGGDVVDEIDADDLCESDGEVIEETELQEAELLRKVHVKTIDPEAGYTVTTQTAERRTSTVKAKGEQTVEIAVVTDKDTQAQIADKKLKVGWAETRRFKTCIPYTRPDLTVTDVIGLTDRKGKRSRVRLMEMSEDSGRISIDEAMLDRQSSYTSNVDGVATQPPTDTSPGLIGPTFGVPMNLPRLTTQDNVPGAYIAACGYLTGWMGCTVLLSADDGVSYQQVATFDQPSSMGVLKADATEGSEPLQVFMRSGSISSVTDSQLASRLNAWAITTGGTSEVGQTKTSVQDSNDIYQLTENVRGALGTLAAAHLEDDPFVMLGSTQFLPLDIGLAGKTLYFKFVSYGTSPDDTEAIPFVFNPQFTGPAVVEPYTDDAGNVYTDDAGNTYFYEGP
jgi:hypothetical protein